MRNYEIMFIVNPNATEEEIDKINGQVENIVTSGGGTDRKDRKDGQTPARLRSRQASRRFLRPVRRSPPTATSSRNASGVFASWTRSIKYITVRMDEEDRRLEKMRNYRQKRAARRGSHAKCCPGSNLQKRQCNEIS